MSHANELRELALGASLASQPEKAAAARAGADALEAIGRVRHALTRIDRLDYDAWVVWKRDADIHAKGHSDAYNHAHTFITEALEGDRE